MKNMKKAVAFLILSAVLLGSCSIKQRIIGTWTDIEGNAWVFSTNGKLSYENGGADDIEVFLFVITDGKLSIKRTDDDDEYHFDNFSLQVYNISFSADGKTLILSEGTSFNGWRTAGPGWRNNQLTRSSKNNSKGNSNANLIDLLIKKAEGGGKVINSMEELKEYLDSRPSNSPDKPIRVKMSINEQMFREVLIAITNSGKYVYLDLTGSPLTTIPGNLTIITDKDGNKGCTTLVGIIIPDSVTKIGAYIFSHCKSLKKVTIPDGVTEIGWFAFASCENLTSVTFEGTINPNKFGILGTGSSLQPAFDGDLREKYIAGGHGTYIREVGSDTWTKK